MNLWSFEVLLIIKHLKMRHLIQIATVILFLVQTIGYSQTENTSNNSKQLASTINEEKTATKINIADFENFIGKYNLEEASITLEVVKEEDKMYIISPWSKDLLELKENLSLYEPTRGVYLNYIKDDKNSLKFFQNGYETTIKRISPKVKN
jgi:hypothetical protein